MQNCLDAPDMAWGHWAGDPFHQPRIFRAVHEVTLADMPPARVLIALPAILITDPRVCWESTDDNTALVQVPFGEAEEIFVARFDPQTERLRFLEAMRYKEATDETKTLWTNEAREWRDIKGHTLMAILRTSWFDEGTPWAVWVPEEVVYNADVRQYVRAAGP